MHGYFASSIEKSEAVKQDAASNNIACLENSFGKYMMSPFIAIKDEGWTLAYSEGQVGATSTFGHVIDHMAVSDHRLSAQVERLIATNQRFSQTKDTDVPITDHNAVQATFDFSSLHAFSVIGRKKTLLSMSELPAAISLDPHRWWAQGGLARKRVQKVLHRATTGYKISFSQVVLGIVNLRQVHKFCRTASNVLWRHVL